MVPSWWVVHEVAERHGCAPAEVRSWPWEDVVRSQVKARAEAEAKETVRKHHEALNGR